MQATWTAITTAAIGHGADLVGDLSPIFVILGGIFTFAAIVAVIRSVVGRG